MTEVTSSEYQNKVINKVIPEFFVKRNNFEPVIIHKLPLQEIAEKFAIDAQVIRIPSFVKMREQKTKTE